MNFRETSTFQGNRGSKGQKRGEMVGMGMRPIEFANTTFQKGELFAKNRKG